jgi:hypothetical protein
MQSHRKLPMKDNNEVISIASHMPAEADFLLVYSTMPGNICYKEIKKNTV